jgi:CheY-like chemotaxis protein
MLTVLGHRGDAKASEQIGVAAYLTKPVRRARLYRCLLDVIGLSRRQPSAEPVPNAIITQHSLAEEEGRRRPRILVADDNDINQVVIVRLLEKFGCRIDVVNNGRDAVAAAARTAYDLVFMDCRMPEMDGFEATRAIRADEEKAGAMGSTYRKGGADEGRPRPSRLPIIALTANVMTDDQQTCLAAGMDGHLSKPVRLEELRSTLARWLGPSVSQAGSSSSGPACR